MTRALSKVSSIQKVYSSVTIPNHVEIRSSTQKPQRNSQLDLHGDRAAGSAGCPAANLGQDIVLISSSCRTRIGGLASLTERKEVLPPESELLVEELLRPRLNKCPRSGSIAVYSGPFGVDRYFFKSQIR